MSESRKIAMQDGRTLEFGENQKMSKEYGTDTEGGVFVELNFDNGETVKLTVDPLSAIGKQALGHGLAQKLGDAAAGAESTNDAYEAVLEVASDDVKEVVGRALASLPVKDLTVENPPLEEVMKELFEKSRSSRPVEAAA